MRILPFLSVFNSVLHGIREMYRSYFWSDFHVLPFQFSVFCTDILGFTFYSYFLNDFIFPDYYLLNCIHWTRNTKFKNKQRKQQKLWLYYFRYDLLKTYFYVGHLTEFNILLCTVNYSPGCNITFSTIYLTQEPPFILAYMHWYLLKRIL